MGVVSLIDPLYIVASQLKTLMPDGMDTLKVNALKTTAAKAESLLTNMWCPHTRKPKSAIAMLLNAMKR